MQNIEVSNHDIQILENLDWRSTTQTLFNGRIRKGEIICSIVGESAKRIIEKKTGRSMNVNAPTRSNKVGVRSTV